MVHVETTSDDKQRCERCTRETGHLVELVMVEAYGNVARYSCPECGVRLLLPRHWRPLNALDPAVQHHVLAALTEPGTPDLPDGLTPREVEVLQLIAEGLTNAEIAERLVVSAATVKSHVNHIFAKAGVRDRAQAVVYAYSNGLV